VVDVDESDDLRDMLRAIGVPNAQIV
jgi:hypothetical protein